MSATRLTDDERAVLLRVARVSIKEALQTGRTPPGGPHGARLNARGTAAVRLLRGQALRAGPGLPDVGDDALWRAVQAASVAAVHGASISVAELATLRIEVAILRAPRRVEPHAPHEPGAALRITTLGRAALVWPGDVAGSPAPALGGACERAGLPALAWTRPEASLELFEPETFADPHEPRR